jgi:hypothetical protein
MKTIGTAALIWLLSSSVALGARGSDEEIQSIERLAIVAVESPPLIVLGLRVVPKQLLGQ